MFLEGDWYISIMSRTFVENNQSADFDNVYKVLKLLRVDQSVCALVDNLR